MWRRILRRSVNRGGGYLGAIGRPARHHAVAHRVTGVGTAEERRVDNACAGRDALGARVDVSTFSAREI